MGHAKFTTSLLTAVAVVVALLGARTSAAILMVDFTNPATPALVQPGFIGQYTADTTYNLPGGVSVFVDLPALADGNDFQDVATRPSSTVLSSGSSFIPDGTNIDALQRDLYAWGNNEGGFLAITLSGVAAGTYDFELWFSDVSIGTNIVQQRVSLSINGGASFTTIGNPPAHGVQPSPFAFTYTANGTDNVVVRVTEDHPTFNQVRLNGFALETQPAPEPASLALLAAGAGMMLASRASAQGRRRRVH